MIEEIHMLNNVHRKNIGIIVELKGRKILIDEVSHRQENEHICKLKKGSKVIITNSKSTFSETTEIIVKFKNLHKMLKKYDRIILNDNKGCLIVNRIRENSGLKTKQKIKNGFKRLRPIKDNQKLNIIQEDKENILNPNIHKFYTRSAFRKSRTYQNMSELNNKEMVNIPKVIYIHPTPNNQVNDSESYFEEDHSEELQKNNKIKLRTESCRNLTEFDYIQKKREKIRRGNSLFQEHKYEIICKVEYDCEIKKDSYIYMPNVDFKKFEVDLLTSREVAEIACLEKLKVNFICITLSNKNDISSLKEILECSSSLRVISSIANYKVKQIIIK
jgi:hypothetical protein